MPWQGTVQRVCYALRLSCAGCWDAGGLWTRTGFLDHRAPCFKRKKTFGDVQCCRSASKQRNQIRGVC